MRRPSHSTAVVLFPPNHASRVRREIDTLDERDRFLRTSVRKGKDISVLLHYLNCPWVSSRVTGSEFPSLIWVSPRQRCIALPCPSVPGPRVPLANLMDKLDPQTQLSSLVKLLIAQSCLTLFDPLDYSPPGFSLHGILQARILEWVVIPFSRGSSPPRHPT